VKDSNMSDSKPLGTGSVFYNRDREAWTAQVYIRDEDGHRRRKAKSYPTEEEAHAGLIALRRANDVRPGEAKAHLPPAGPNSTVFFDRTRSKWVGQFRYEENGKRRAKTRICATERDAHAAVREVAEAHVEARPIAPGPEATVAKWLAYYCTYVMPTEENAPDTDTNQRGYVRREIAPSKLARVRLVDLQALDVYEYLTGLVHAGKGNSTVKGIRSVLNKALRSAVLHRCLDPNVTAALAGQRLVRPRATEAIEVKVKTVRHDDARLLQKAAADVDWEPLVTTFLGTGLRRGEAIALRWSDIDFEAGTMRYHAAIAGDGAGGEVYGLTKTGVSAIDTLAPLVLDALRRQQVWQQEARRAFIRTWAKGELFSDFVFTNTRGQRLKADHVTKRIDKIAATAGIGHVTPHMLRHSAASYLAAAGAPLRVIQRVLHHADESTTRDIYIHLLERAYAEGTDALDAVLRQLAAEAA
jgi:integrase